MPFHADSPLARLIATPVRPGRIVWIGIRPGRREPMAPVDMAELDPGLGVVGDRYAKAGGARQITLIQAESLATIASHMGVAQVLPDDLRRNLVTRGINLLALKGRRVRVGDALLDVTGECHPCSRMEETLGAGGYNAVRGLGGITARVISGGRVALGDPVAPDPVEAGPYVR